MAMLKCPMSAKEVLDTYFLDNRARLLEIAAFLDRIDRTEDPNAGKVDYRYKALKKALKILVDGEESRTKALQMSFSDLSIDPLKSAAGLKGAYGAWEEAFHEDH